MIFYLIILITAVISIVSFNDRGLFEKLKFNAFDIKHSNEGWRFFTYAFVHVDWIHLLVNMYVLYMFGEVVLAYFNIFFAGKAGIYFILLYVGGILFSTLRDFQKHKENVFYNAVGASGAVAAVVFSSIILRPTAALYLFFIPIPIPAAVFGVLYLIYSAYMSKKSKTNIGHNAHFWGAIFGIVFTIILKPSFFTRFIDQIQNYF